MGFGEDNLKGVILALLSSGFIGASFIIKKKGLRRAAAASGVRAGVGGYTYLLEPLWWIGMITMIVGEAANFIAYAFAPALLVTPLGALSIIVSAVLAHFILKERLHKLGVLGCVMCIAGSVIIVVHAPRELPITSVQEIWIMATQPAFLLYMGSVIVLVIILVIHFAPRCGHTNVLVFTGICSLMGSLSVMSVKALGTSLKLTFEGKNQLIYPETWFFMLVVVTCVIIQMSYLNKENEKKRKERDRVPRHSKIEIAFYLRFLQLGRKRRREMEAKVAKFFGSVSNFFSGGDHIPWCDRDVIAGCEREVAEAEKGSSDELLKESIMRLSWALVHSRQPEDVQRGIAMLEAALSGDVSPLKMREKLYLLSVGYFRSGDYSRSRELVEQCLTIAPDWRQARTLKKSIEDGITKDGVIGIGIAATAVGLIAGGIAAAVARKK